MHTESDTRDDAPPTTRDLSTTRIIGSQQRTAMHINFVWRSLQDVMYQRLVDDREEQESRELNHFINSAPDGTKTKPATLFVRGDPRGDVEVPCSNFILTNGAASIMSQGTTSVQACEAYLRKGCCRRGYACPYAHLIVLGDADGEPVQGRFRPARPCGTHAKRDHQPASKEVTDDKGSASDASHDGTGLEPHTTAAHLSTTAMRPPSETETSISWWWYRDPYTGTRVRCQRSGSSDREWRRKAAPDDDEEDVEAEK